MESLRRRRGVLRTTVTKKMTALDALLQNPAAPALELQMTLDMILDKQRALHELDSQIQASLHDDEFDADVLDAIDYDERISALRTRVRCAMSPTPSASAASAESGEPCGSAPSQPRPGIPQATQGTRFAALPKLQIPMFSGDRRDWQGFWDQFDCSIHSNATLPRIEKFKYLLSYLSGPAKDAIDGIRLADDNYDFAVKVITNRFGRKDLLVDDHLDKLLALEPVQNSADTYKLRVLYDTVTFRINALEGLGVSPDQYSVVLHRVLLRTLPHDLGLLYRQMLKEAQQDGSEVSASPSDRSKEIKAILEFLRVQVEIREESASDRSVPPTRRSHGRQQSSSPSIDLPTTMTLGTQSPSSGLHGCGLCNARDHAIACCSAPISPEEKRKRLQARKCCFRCGKGNHFAKQCRSANSLVCGLCSRRHLTTLCDIQHPVGRFEPASRRPDSSRSDKATIGTANTVTSASTSAAGPTPVLLQTGRAWGLGTSRQLLVRFLLDSGSQRTFIRRDLSRALDCPVDGVERLTIATFGSNRTSAPVSCNRVSLTLKSQHDNQHITIEALEVPNICKVTSPPVSEEILNSMAAQCQVAADARLSATFQEHQISVLIGSDAYWKVATGRVSRISSSLTAVETVLGWTVQGAQLENPSPSTAHSSALFLSLGEAPPEDAAADVELSSMWRLEAIGIQGTSENFGFNDPAVHQFQYGIRKVSGRYEVPLLIREPGLDVSDDNYVLAEQRLCMQLKRFRGQPDLLRQYDRTIRAYFDEGHAERVTRDREDGKQNTYYMPHHGVVRRDAVTTKLRVVFDASSHVPGHPSLNSVLLKGPKLDAQLLKLLVEFRCHHVVLVADIKKAYLQMVIREEDRNALRFLWVEHLPNQEDPLPPIVHWRMTRVPFGATSSPFLLAATLRHHLKECKEEFPDTVAKLVDAFYVDDLVVGVENAEQAKRIYAESRSILAGAGMELRKWASNLSSLRDQFLEDKVAFETEGGDPCDMKVLGMLWDRSDDSVVLSADSVATFVSTKPVTKRTMLQSFARLYDPLGFLAPFTVRAKIIFQDLWKLQHPWDSPLPTAQLNAWNSWCGELSDLRHICLPRHAFTMDTKHDTRELHVFADASPRAYETAVYVRSLSWETGNWEVNLLLSKGRIAPIRTTSLPRLELLACLIAARLFDFLKRIPCLSKVQPFFWTDSKIALHWIAGEPSRWPPFVRNRVSEIQRLTQGHGKWAHCRSKDNPADLITRGLSASAVAATAMWWHGPLWLALRTQEGPTDREGVADVSEPPVPQTASCALVTTPAEPLLSIRSYSRYSRLLRVTAWIHRFFENTRRLTHSARGPLTSDEVLKAERYWLRFVQNEAFPEDIRALSRGQRAGTAARLMLLRPFLDDDGILRVGGRLQQLGSSVDTRHPIILPGRHEFSRLLIIATHQRLLHAGVDTTLTELRGRFWIIKGRQVVKTVVHGCLLCRRHRLAPETAPVSPLPRDRITESSPFDVVGVDFCGPLFCRTKDPAQTKAYVAVFSCGVTRAVHLELTSQMTSSSFLSAFRRFIARRGIPSTIYSDNALAFQHCARSLRSAPEDPVLDFCSSRNISWKFNVERAPWWGGWWERLIRLTKECLRRILGRSCLTAEELQTTLCEVEAVINSRPLTYLSADATEPYPLTPAHFWLGKSNTCLPQRLGLPEPLSTGSELRRRARHRQIVTERLWRRWKREYLLLLRSAHEATPQLPSRLQVGDVVLVQDNSPPAFWQLGRILQLFPGRDGVVRSCSLRLSSGREIRRPVQRLCFFEASP